MNEARDLDKITNDKVRLRHKVLHLLVLLERRKNIDNRIVGFSNMGQFSKKIYVSLQSSNKFKYPV